MNRLTVIMTFVASLSVTGAAAPPVLAQQQAGGSGRALDANPRAGSGGTNSPEGQVDYNARNDIVTGDVSGGRGLRIEQPYRAANEFGDVLGSDDLFDFRAQSLPSAPSQLNAVQAPVNLGGSQSVYRSYSSTPNTIRGAYQVQRQVAPEGGYFTADQLAAPSRILPGGRFDGQQAYDPFDIYAVSPTAPTVTPLLGMRQQDFEAMRPAMPRPSVGAGIDRFEDVEDRLTDPRRDMRLGLPAYQPLLTDPQRSTEPTRPGQDDVQEGDDEATDQPGLRPTMLMGRQLQSRLGAERADQLDARVEQRVNRLGDSLRRQAERQRAADESSPYATLLDAIQGNRRSEDTNGRRGRRAAVDLGTLDESQAQQAERQRTEALRRAFGDEADQEDAGENGDTAGEGEGDASDPERVPGYSDPLAGLLERLNYDIAPLDSLAGDRATPVNQLMKQAETMIASGQYFDAERTYRQVLDRSEDPMARVGLVHAQLGAGMIRSAARNLRSLFEQHPELIAAQYQANLLPGEERLRWVRGELERALESGQSGSEPALLLAYLGYQVDSRQLVRYGLATAEARSPRDPLMPVLRHIWLDQNQTDNSSQSDN